MHVHVLKWASIISRSNLDWIRGQTIENKGFEITFFKLKIRTTRNQSNDDPEKVHVCSQKNDTDPSPVCKLLLFQRHGVYTTAKATIWNGDQIITNVYSMLKRKVKEIVSAFYDLFCQSFFCKSIFWLRRQELRNMVWWCHMATYMFGYALAQVMACWWTALSYQLNQCSLIIKGVNWHVPESNCTRSANELIFSMFQEIAFSTVHPYISGAHDIMSYHTLPSKS